MNLTKHIDGRYNIFIPVMETRVSNPNPKIGFRNNNFGIFLKGYM